MPKFSIIVPAYNAEERIEKVLNSITYQERVKDYELIVVCDNCTDNTANIVREKYSNAKVFEVNFGNDGLSRSKGLDEATGDWIMFLDDDDWWLHEFVLDILDKALISCNHELDILQAGFVWKGKGYYGSCKELDGTIRLYSNVWTKCFRREFIGDTRFPNVYSVSDMKFIEALLLKHPRIKVLDHPIYYYNWLREGSISELEHHKKEEQQ